jgi:two-component system, OmpR family, phosphate regulon response regulator PhoB
MTRILVVEDDAAIAEVLRYNLAADRHDVTVSDTAEDAVLLLEEHSFDLMILDWMLPGMSGIELCRRLRLKRETKALPVLMLTARSEESDSVRGLSTGADDYVVKPFSVAELMARVKALLRRSAPDRIADVLRYDDIELDRAAHGVTRGGVEVRIGPTEFKLLLFFLENRGRVQSRQQLLDGVWGRDSVIDERTVDVHVGRLRKALCVGDGGGATGSDDARDPIRTVRGGGYVFGQR